MQGKAASGALAPAQNAQITVNTTDGKMYSDVTTTDESRAYSISNLAAGSYLIDVAPQGDTTGFIPRWWKNKRTECTATPITIRTGQTKANINVVLANSTLKSTIPKITGLPKVGRTLPAKASKWGPGTVTFGYQWSRRGTAIAVPPVLPTSQPIRMRHPLSPSP